MMQNSSKKTATEQALAIGFDNILGDDPQIDLLIYSADSVLNFLTEVQDRLAAKGMTQSDMARQLGVKRSQLNRWLRHESGLNAKIMFQMARALGFDLECRWIERSTSLTVLNGGSVVNGSVQITASNAVAPNLAICHKPLYSVVGS